MRITALTMLAVLMAVPVRVSAQDRWEQVLDSLVAASECPRPGPTTEDWVGNLSEIRLCALVAAALDHLDNQDKVPWDHPDGRLPPGSHAGVSELHAYTNQGRIAESMWRVWLTIPESDHVYLVFIDQRGGHIAAETNLRAPEQPDEPAGPSLETRKLRAAFFPEREDRSEPWHAKWWGGHEIGTMADAAPLLARFGLCGDPKSYHLVDFTGDRRPELVYSGAATKLSSVDGECVGVAEGAMTTLFELGEDGLRPLLEEMGYIAWMPPPSRGHVISEIVLRFDGCCGDLDSHITVLVPADGEPLSFRTADSITLRDEGGRPTVLFDEPKPFRVTQERYHLRAFPEIVDFADEPEQFVGAFGSGATGVALGESTDSTGRIWWFVIMDSLSPPLGPQPSDHTARLAGWMSSRYLERIK